MIQTQVASHLPGLTCAISDTGPLISVFQSDSLSILTQIFGQIYVPGGCAEELEEHGWQLELQDAVPFLTIVELDASERERAFTFAGQIAHHPAAKNADPQHHLGEAQGIVLVLRPEHRDDLLLLDERVAREIAKQAGVRLSGFPGALLLAAQVGLISPDELRERLETCCEKGTHYSSVLISQVCEMAKQRQR
jgi:predicted nucleic acid-binding protein